MGLVLLAWVLRVVDFGWWALLVAAVVAFARGALFVFRSRDKAIVSGSAFPFVTVQLPVRNERAVVETLLACVAALDWPRDRLQIQVLDDSDPGDLTSALIDARAASLGHIEVLRRKDRAGFKAGNLAHGLLTARGEFLLVLDADSRPSPSLIRDLMSVMGDPAVGFSQARWDFYNRGSLLTRIGALILDGHFVIEQARASDARRPVQLNGTSCLIRRSALDAAGGWVPGEASVTEDLDLSARMWAAGFRGVTLVDVSVETELPSDVGAYRIQQARWLRGAGELVRRAVQRRQFGRMLGLLARQIRQPAMVVLLLTAPLRLWRVGMPVVWYALLGALWLSAGAYYFGAQRRAGHQPHILDIPGLVLLSLGLSLALTTALAKGLFSARPGEFIRTAKRGDGQVVYRRPVQRAFGELLVGMALLGFAGFALYQRNIVGAISLAFLAIGPFMVGIKT